jgi:protein-tyrosine phosphatase
MATGCQISRTAEQVLHQLREAQGHGRTGLVAAAVLIAKGMADNNEAALAIRKTSRPKIDLNRQQNAFLKSFCEKRNDI